MQTRTTLLSLFVLFLLNTVCLNTIAQDLPCDFFQGNLCANSGCEVGTQACEHPACGSDSIRYKSQIFDSTSILMCTELFVTVSDSSNPATDSNAVDLFIDIYYNPEDCQCCNRPAILLGASGGFNQQDRRNNLMLDLAMDYAQRGFVVFTYDYRTGFFDCCKPDSNLAWACRYTGDPVQFENAVYRGQQDITTAIIYLKANADRFGINPNLITIGGMSAGAGNAINSAYMAQFEGISRRRKDLGMLNKYAIPGFDNTIAGVISMWGVLLDINALAINAKGEPENIPSIYFHGTCDASLPYTDGQFDCYFYPDSTEFTVYGPHSIQQEAIEKDLPMCLEVHAACGFAHGIHNTCRGEVPKATSYLTRLTRYITHHSSKFLYDNVLDCETECTAQDRFICKPCYCKSCSNEDRNSNPTGCRNCKDKALYPTDRMPEYIENCDSENQNSGWVNCYKVARASDPDCIYMLTPSNVQSLFANMVIKHDHQTDQLHLEWISTIDVPFKIMVHDVLGKEFHLELIEIVKGMNTHTISLHQLQRGAYILSIRNGRNQKGYKFFH